jgi:hypothetical protein
LIRNILVIGKEKRASKMAQVDVEAFTLLALALAFIAVRMGVRWRQVGPKNFQLDDYLMPLAGVSYSYYFMFFPRMKN